MALIERVDTTMYAFGGPRHFLALGGVIAAVVACQSHPPPGECKARADEVAHYVAALDRSPRLVDATAWDSLHLVERRELPAPADAAPTLVVEADRFVYAGESIESADELALALRNAATTAPVLGLAIDRAAPWSRVVQAFERADREGFAQVDLYYAPPAAEPAAPATLDTSHCELLGRALDQHASRAIAPAFEACGCRADQAALEVSAWAVLANHHPVRAVRIQLDRTGTIEAHPGAETWAEIAPSVRPGAGWLTAR